MNTRLKHIPSYKYCIIACCLLLLFMLPGSGAIASARKNTKRDSTLRESKVREVLLSQQLFMVKMTPVKGKKSKRKIVDFRAELRDAFMVVCYDKDKTVTELDWSICPDGKCPQTGTFNYGTPGYTQLDSIIAGAKSNALKWEHKVAVLKRGMKNSIAR